MNSQRALAQDWHRWHPTFTLGEKVCLVCGLYAYCPQCQHRQPSAVRLMLCTLHRRDEGRARDE